MVLNIAFHLATKVGSFFVAGKFVHECFPMLMLDVKSKEGILYYARVFNNVAFSSGL